MFKALAPHPEAKRCFLAKIEPYPLEEKLARAWPTGLWGQVRVLVAVSGGADSVALLRGMQRLSRPELGELVVGHFNHRLRPETADRDEQFVVELAASLALRCEVQRCESTLSAGNVADGVEAAARSARYQFLIQTAERLGARYVVTGHTADDQAETILHHVMRGTGLTGLSGMPRVRRLSPAVSLLRPLLDVRRSEVIAYLADLGQPYCDDETNDDQAFTRNQIRHELLPLLQRSYSPSIVESLLRLGTVAGDAQRVIEVAAKALLESHLSMTDDNKAAIDCRSLASCDRHLVREMFVALWRHQQWPRQSMGFEQWDSLADLAQARDGAIPPAMVLPGAISAQRTGEQLVLARS